MLNSDEIRQIVITVAVTAVIAIAMFWGETYRRQSREFAKAEEFFEAGNLKQAITAYESAIHMYTPFSTMIEISSERLKEIGRTYENQGDIDMALIAYRSLRSSFYATRSTYLPYEETVEFCEERIATLVQRQEAQDASITGQSSEGAPPTNEAGAPAGP